MQENPVFSLHSYGAFQIENNMSSAPVCIAV